VIAHCDALTVTTPLEGDAAVVVSPAVQDVLDAAGVSLEVQSPVMQLFRTKGGGILRVSSRARVQIIYTSGALLTHLRSQQMYGAFLSALSMQPHRVTRLDACVDIFSAAHVVVAALALKGRDGAVALSRKAIRPCDIDQRTRVAHYDASVLTGSVYLGNRATAKVYMLVYDKRNERLDAGLPDPGAWVRFELVVRSEMGPTLRDASDPTSMFFHFAAPDVLDRPPNVAPWVSHAEGFTLEKLTPATPMQKIYQLLDSSPDVARLLKYIEAAGPESIRLATARLERMARGATCAPGAFTAPNPSGVSREPTSIPSAALEAPATLQ
jgi:hypothetical protein